MGGPIARTVDLRGPVHYVDHGGQGSPPIVLVHGLALSHASWAGVAESLAGKRRVYAVDFVGHGLTPRAGRTADLPSHRELIDGFLDKVVGEPAILVGHSTGGHLAVVEAALAPERVAGLVLVDAATPIPSASLKLVLTRLSVLPLRLPGTGELITRTVVFKADPEATTAAILASCTPHPERIPADLVAANVEVTRAWQASGDAERSFLETARSLFRENDQAERFYERASAVKVPVLAVHGDLDPLVPLAAARELARRRPDWHLHVFPGIGHAPMLEDAGALLPVIEAWAAEQQAAWEARRPA